MALTPEEKLELEKLKAQRKELTKTLETSKDVSPIETEKQPEEEPISNSLISKLRKSKGIVEEQTTPIKATETAPVLTETLTPKTEEDMSALEAFAYGAGSDASYNFLDEVLAKMPFNKNVSKEDLLKYYRNNIEAARGTLSGKLGSIMSGAFAPNPFSAIGRIKKSADALTAASTAAKKYSGLKNLVDFAKPTKEALIAGATAGVGGSDADLSTDAGQVFKDAITGATAASVLNLGAKSLNNLGKVLTESDIYNLSKRAYDLGEKGYDLGNKKDTEKFTGDMNLKIGKITEDFSDKLGLITEKYGKILENTNLADPKNEKFLDISNRLERVRDYARFAEPEKFVNLDRARNDNDLGVSFEDLLNYEGPNAKNRDVGKIEKEVNEFFAKFKNKNLPLKELKGIYNDVLGLYQNKILTSKEREILNSLNNDIRSLLNSIPEYKEITDAYKYPRIAIEALRSGGIPSNINTEHLSDLGNTSEQKQKIFEAIKDAYEKVGKERNKTDRENIGGRVAFEENLRQIPKNIQEEFNIDPEHFIERTKNIMMDNEVVRKIQEPAWANTRMDILRDFVGAESLGGMTVLAANKVGANSGIVGNTGNLIKDVVGLPFDVINKMGSALIKVPNEKAKMYGKQLMDNAANKSRTALNATLFTMMQSKDTRELLGEFLPNFLGIQSQENNNNVNQ